MSQYAIKRTIDRTEERHMLDLDRHMLRLKQQMANELAASVFRDWGDKPFTRDPETGMLTLRFTATIMEDAEVDVIRRNAVAVGVRRQRELEERVRPYGLDEVYE